MDILTDIIVPDCQALLNFHAPRFGAAFWQAVHIEFIFDYDMYASFMEGIADEWVPKDGVPAMETMIQLAFGGNIYVLPVVIEEQAEDDLMEGGYFCNLAVRMEELEAIPGSDVDILNWLSLYN